MLEQKQRVSRRGFVGGVATALGYLTVKSPSALFAESNGSSVAELLPPAMGPLEDYDALAKLSFNENPYGPPESVLKAMTTAFKYANRYGYPDGGIVEAIAKHHNVKPENVVLGAGSGELLDVMGSAFSPNGKKVIGASPSYEFVYSHVSGVHGDSITLPLTADYRQDIPAIIHATKTHYRDVGFVYICNPNNPTGRIVTKQEIRQLLDGIPADVPVLIDEAYWHFVEDSDYGTSVPYVIEGRPVLVTRTFSKIAALAGMRLGYGIAQPDLIKQLQPYISDSISAVVKWGGVAALADTDSQAKVKRVTTELRKKTTSELEAMGYPVIPSETNFFMVNLKRPVKPVIDDFKKRGVLVGRPFPPMMEHLRVSIGTADEMNRFTVAFRDIMSKPAMSAAGGTDGA
ncbi:MAG TPA: histidinol-phosphate transaminase [Gemmatimonadaceae bacterium]|jgi:histidinol-phosphate aminotransferase|nr:histidinol-phosphate transaminase [Gemmatimonadaceae bacterium]